MPTILKSKTSATKITVGALVTLGAMAMFAVPVASAATFYGWDNRGGDNDSILYGYDSASNFSTDTGGSIVGDSTGSHIFFDVFTDGSLYYGYASGGGAVFSYPTAVDLGENNFSPSIGSGNAGLEGAAADWTTYYGWDRDTTTLTSYTSAANLGTGTGGTVVGSSGKSTIDAIAADGSKFYGWDQDTTTLYSYSSASDFANDISATVVDNSGSAALEGIAADMVLAPGTLLSIDFNQSFEATVGSTVGDHNEADINNVGQNAADDQIGVWDNGASPVNWWNYVDNSGTATALVDANGNVTSVSVNAAGANGTAADWLDGLPNDDLVNDGYFRSEGQVCLPTISGFSNGGTVRRDCLPRR